MNSAITPASFGASTEALRTLSPAYKRIYQACIPCRRRKVRCDLGPVDEPHEPPCVRCKRESKDCFFSATRRKRKATGEVIDEEAALEDDYAIRNRRRRSSHLARSSSGDGVLPHHTVSIPLARALYDGSRSRSYHRDLESSGSQHEVPEQGSRCISSVGQEEDEEVSNETAAALFHSPIHNPRDALHLLLEASGRSEVLDRDFTNTQEHIQHFSSTRANYGSKGEPSVINLEGGRLRRGTNTRNIDPTLGGQSRKANTLGDPYLQDALRAWYHLRFVRAGWFTAQEAMSYIDYFFDNLAPLSPVALPNFRSTQTHPHMLQEEPILSVTILTIAARYKRLPGPGGQSRSFVIHERLSAYLQNMLTRAFWAQEQYGGGFCGAGYRSTFSGGTKGVGLRSVGTIESILLICDWHPRSMHFNPGDDDGQLLLPPKEDTYARFTPDIVRGDGKLNRKEALCMTWDEPALRSDQMSWSLLGMAYTLALELGIFGTFDASSSFDNRISLSSAKSLENRGRTQRIKRLLYIYITQVSGRLGLPSMLPEHYQAAQTSMDDYSVLLPASEAVEDVIQQAWVKAASIIATGNAMVFPTKDTARHLIQSGDYFRMLDDHLLPLLESWRKAFKVLNIPQYPRIMLSIEYEYIRIYFNSLAVQAVLNRWTNANPAAQKTRNEKDDLSRSSLMGFYKRNEYYIREVVDGSRNLLRHIVVGLLPNDHLKHATVRTYNRILSGATFLLKTLALGGKESEVNISLRLLDDTAKALRTSVVDDVHLCLRIADLLEGLTTTIRYRFVRIAVSATHKSNITGPRLSNESSERLRPLQSSDTDVHTNPHAYITSNSALADNQPPEQSPASNLNTSTPLNYNDMNSDPTDGSYNAPADTFTFPGTEDWLTLDFDPLLDAADNAGMNEWFANIGPDIHNNLDGLGRFMDGFGDEGLGDGGGGFG